ncbi:MAG: DUF5011 domain-containing protein [Bacilli bacterium]|nr:DUF5011 domain-containing protein [Bacilli bacterium]MBP3920769.1 DUF5011 domain-containing protein [Bacilli bacterium]
MNNRYINKKNELNFNNVIEENIEIIEIDDIEVEIIEVYDDINTNNATSVSLDKINVKESFLTKIRKKLTNKKFAIITISCATIMVTLTGLFILDNTKMNTYKKHNNIVYNEINDNTNFTLNEPEYNTININEPYEEKGAKITVDGIDKSEEINIDTSKLDITKPGIYHVIYKYPININQIKTLYRTINVVDNEAPTIKLLGSNIYTMTIGEEFINEGVIVTDNSNEELIDKVKIESNINNTIPGTYYVKYTVSDSSGNTSNITRKVIVKNTYANNSNTILYNSFNDNGIFLKGCVQDYSFKYQMLLKNKTTGNEIIIDTNKTSEHYYSLTLNTSNLENGNYEFYLVNDELELLTNNMNDYSKIVRSHIGNKLITMNYDKNNVNMIVEDFEYQYDVVIDPGHGGTESGATNGKYIEKSINLEQSLYEKKRFEDHGLKVLLLRDTDENYGIMMGNTSWENIDKKGYAVGYYGAVSKIIYSNHHNSSGNTTSAGWEILVPAKATYEDLKTEHQIADTWSNTYIEQTNPYYRFYTKDYETASSNNKMNGEIYSFEDYYAVIRIPNKLFNVKNVLYEGAYINNDNDMWWYYDNNNWKTLSETKIKAYVESIGVTYIAP